MIAHLANGSKAVNGTPAFIQHHVSRGLGNVYAREYAGAGPAFGLMHGFPDNLHIHDDLVPLLVAAGRRGATFDFVGFGHSEKPADACYSCKQQLEDLKAVADHLDLRTLIPVAHASLDAAAVDFAIEYPDRNASLGILDAAFAESSTAKWPEQIWLFATGSLQALPSAIIRSPEQFGWIVNFQREQFQQSRSGEHKFHYDDFLAPLIDRNFTQPGAGPALWPRLRW